MTPSITTKLFLAIFLTSVASVVAMGLVARTNLSRGFVGYLNQQALERAHLLQARLAQAYAAHGSWRFLRDDSKLWYALLRSSADHAVGVSPDRPPAADLLGANLRIALFDARRRPVINTLSSGERDAGRWLAIDDHGHTVGWLRLATLQKATSAADVHFEQRQYRAIWIISALALLLSAALAFWLARALLAPVRQMARATHRLAAGRYDTRVNFDPRGDIGQLARDFNNLAYSLERNEHMRRTVMAEISHELRTPLAILRGELEAIEDGVRQPTPDALYSLAVEVRLLTQLVDDLYDLSLSDAGALAYRKVEMDIVDVLVDTVHAHLTRFENAAIAVDYDVPGDAVMLLADETRLTQLFRNLLTNSLRYTDAGGRLRITLDGRDEGVAVVFEDSAPGVSAADRARLFIRFFRAESSRSRRSGGSGLGLAICRNIVEAHGGTIAAEASVLGGLRIMLRLPRNLG